MWPCYYPTYKVSLLKVVAVRIRVTCRDGGVKRERSWINLTFCIVYLTHIRSQTLLKDSSQNLNFAVEVGNKVEPVLSEDFEMG